LLNDTVEEAGELFAALARTDKQTIFIYPNADSGSRELIRRAEQFASKHRNSRVLVNLDHRTYLSLLRSAGVLVGNSSSGIIESTSLEMPAVNVGIRQLGREHAANVIDVPADRKAIGKVITRALSADFRKQIRELESPYGNGGAAKVICDVLLNAPLGRKLLLKRAVHV
jgi:UDP-N-acetylglucosamine 2-epimerase (non-hydrolysing)/GDP/UDP-N,N'-diacetylbacillosamine 2-epimerase (hydrolysing)